MSHQAKDFGSKAMLFFGALCLIAFFERGEGFGAPAPQLVRTHSGGGVTVKATFLNPQGADDVRFEVVLDTHSVNLDSYDLKNLSLLRDDAGQSYPPTQVENKGSGHHREFTLIFPKPSAGTKRLELVIQDIAKVKEHSFSWNLSR